MSVNRSGTDIVRTVLPLENVLSNVIGFETDEIALSAGGVMIDTHSGVRYIDFTGGVAVHAVGHSHPDVVDAITGQAALFAHTSDVMKHAPQIELATFLRARLDEAAPGESPWTFLFLNSGSESIDAAAKLAIKATGRSQFVAFEGAFHGRTLFATALSRSKTAHSSAYEPFLGVLKEQVRHAAAPRCEQCAFTARGESCCRRSAVTLMDRIGEGVAAVFIEPQQGEGGYFPMSADAAMAIRDTTRQHGALLICDEIQTGCGRTGRWFGFEHLGIEPDIVVFGKAVGGGLPLAGIAARADLFDKWSTGEHGTTFGGNPIACAAGLAALRVIEREGLVERAHHLGHYIKGVLCPLIGSFGVGNVRGNGLMIGIELRDGGGRPDYARCDRVKSYAREEGLLLLTCGANIGKPDVDCAALRLIPALNIEQSLLDKGLGILIRALEAVSVR